MTYDELVEKVAKIVVNNNLFKVPSRTTAEEIIATIREALQEPTDEMSRCTLLTKNEVKLYWPELLAASPLGEKAG